MRILLVVLTAVLLAGCAAMPWNWGGKRSLGRYPEQSAGQVLTRFVLSGRLAIATGSESGSGRIDWEQDLDRYTIRLRAPVSGQSWRLRGDAAGAALEGLHPEPVLGRSAEDLLLSELGFDLPVAALRHWVQGLSADRSGRLQRDADGWPTALDEGGWHIEYRDWQTGFDPPLPGRIEARRGSARLRLAISRWQIETVEVGGGG